MTALGIRLRLAISRSKLPEKAIISAIEGAIKSQSKIVTFPAPINEADKERIAREWMKQNGFADEKPKRTYRRRDMRAE